jgi:hypothetical protein
MPEKQSPLTDLEIDELIGIHIPQPGTFAMREIERDRFFKASDAAVHPSGDASLGAVVELFGFRECVGHG